MTSGIEAAIFGAVQGLGEFLPISSSGHLVLLHSVTHFTVADDLAFDVALHLGTLVALVAYFWRDLWRLAKAWVRSFHRGKDALDNDQRLAWLIVIASVPGAIAGLALEQTIATAFRAPLLTGIVLIIAGILLWVVDRTVDQTRELSHLRWTHALAIGFAQAAALIPGVSRSGATITVGRWLHLDRAAAARFSFLLSAPILVGAGATKMLDLRQLTLTSAQQLDFLIGAVVAAVVGWLSIRVLLRYISSHSYAVFMWYRLLVGALAIVFVIMTR